MDGDFFEMLGGIARFHVPHRLLEGYGLQSNVLEAAAAGAAAEDLPLIQRSIALGSSGVDL